MSHDTKTPTETPTEYRIEVIADNSGKWCGNARRFDNEADAEAYAFDLACRWTAVRDWRVVQVSPQSEEVTI